MKKIKVLYDFQTMFLQKYGGISRYFFELFTSFKEEHSEQIDIKLSLFYSCNYYFSVYKKCHKSGPTTVASYLNNINTLINIYFNYFKGTPYDIIHPTYYYPNYLKYVPAFIKKKSKIVLTVYDLIIEMFYPEIEDLKKRGELITTADSIIVISEQTKKDLLKIYSSIPEERIKVIYLGNFMKKPIEDCKIQFPSNYILMVGNRAKYKNGEIVFEAFKKIKDRFKEIWLVCAGGGEFSNEEHNNLRKLGIEDYVIQMSLTDDMLYYAYKNAKCFVFPSLYEGFGLPILEAFFCECPVILSDASCFPEIANDSALLFSPENVDELAQKITILLTDDNIAKELVEKGKNRLKFFDVEKMISETLKVYQDICAK